MRVVDLSLGGARLSTDVEVPVGAPVRLAVESPTRWDTLELPGRVAWTQSRGGGTELGVCFEPSPAVLRGLLDLLRANAYE